MSSPVFYSSLQALHEISPSLPLATTNFISHALFLMPSLLYISDVLLIAQKTGMVFAKQWGGSQGGVGKSLMLTKIKFLNRSKVLENASIFKNCNIFLARRKNFPSKFNLEKFGKIIFKISKFQFFESSIKSREISDEWYFLLLEFVKTLKYWLRSRRTIRKEMKIFENFCGNRLYFVEEFELINI